MSRRKYPVIENLEITNIAAEGKALGKYNGKVIFVPYATPGDVVNVQVVRSRSGYMEGIISEFIHQSETRVQPFCSHFGICGGCKWQHIPYSEQLAFKQQQVVDQLSRIGKFTELNMQSILGSANEQYYRNKLEFTFSNKRWRTKEEMNCESPLPSEALGFHIPGLFDKVLDIDACFLQPEPSNALRRAVKDYAVNHGLSFFDIRTQSGFLRTMIVRNSVSSGEVMVVMVFGEDKEKERIRLLQYLQQQFPAITSLQYVINTKGNDTINDLEVVCFHGKPYIEEKMDGIVFSISPKSFFQTNTLQAQKLYRLVRDFAALQGHEILYDLYTGIGTIALYLAAQAKKAVGIEYVPEAIEDAKKNAERNNIRNTIFYAGDMKDLLTPAFFAANGDPDVIVLDPPRAGIHLTVAENVLKSGAQRLVYVSCNPATQARDMAVLAAAYRIVKVQPVDMFPHTHHVENVILAEKIQ
ncbi:MAG: 23S rRNA (uracil(1939)-C(5))-methyltransferase RlmD [Bacteroidales bacterium]|nr:23S rRNA (uracil(1939)-C(5))-methyltransferase RlmD [Bacteroidales bacterium]MCL2133809.1 23S rRNA (uracil(1939)-C(5))-methyltransferase RlmD [Bacteroidales bacterium]